MERDRPNQPLHLWLDKSSWGPVRPSRYLGEALTYLAQEPQGAEEPVGQTELPTGTGVCNSGGQHLGPREESQNVREGLG